jgi:RimJ/RimL family protein N-acetyltransferase
VISLPGRIRVGDVRSTPIPPPAGPLTDGTVCLRYRQATDLDAIRAASHDPETRRWLNDPPMDDEARAASMTRVADAFQSGRAAPLVIADRVTNQAIGLINVQFRDDRVATIAYSVFPGHRGQGVAPRAVRLAVNWAFSQLGLSELLLEIDPENLASLRVARKCGFTPAGDGPDRDEGGDSSDGKLVFALRKGEAGPRADAKLARTEPRDTAKSLFEAVACAFVAADDVRSSRQPVRELTLGH